MTSNSPHTALPPPTSSLDAAYLLPMAHAVNTFLAGRHRVRNPNHLDTQPQNAPPDISSINQQQQSQSQSQRRSTLLSDSTTNTPAPTTTTTGQPRAPDARHLDDLLFRRIATVDHLRSAVSGRVPFFNVVTILPEMLATLASPKTLHTMIDVPTLQSTTTTTNTTNTTNTNTTTTTTNQPSQLQSNPTTPSFPFLPPLHASSKHSKQTSATDQQQQQQQQSPTNPSILNGEHPITTSAPATTVASAATGINGTIGSSTTSTTIGGSADNSTQNDRPLITTTTTTTTGRRTAGSAPTHSHAQTHNHAHNHARDDNDDGSDSSDDDYTPTRQPLLPRQMTAFGRSASSGSRPTGNVQANNSLRHMTNDECMNHKYRTKVSNWFRIGYTLGKAFDIQDPTIFLKLLGAVFSIDKQNMFTMVSPAIHSLIDSLQVLPTPQQQNSQQQAQQQSQQQQQQPGTNIGPTVRGSVIDVGNGGKNRNSVFDLAGDIFSGFGGSNSGTNNNNHQQQQQQQQITSDSQNATNTKADSTATATTSRQDASNVTSSSNASQLQQQRQQQHSEGDNIDNDTIEEHRINSKPPLLPQHGINSNQSSDQVKSTNVTGVSSTTAAATTTATTAASVSNGDSTQGSTTHHHSKGESGTITSIIPGTSINNNNNTTATTNVDPSPARIESQLRTPHNITAATNSVENFSLGGSLDLGPSLESQLVGTNSGAVKVISQRLNNFAKQRSLLALRMDDSQLQFVPDYVQTFVCLSTLILKVYTRIATGYYPRDLVVANMEAFVRFDGKVRKFIKGVIKDLERISMVALQDEFSNAFNELLVFS